MHVLSFSSYNLGYHSSSHGSIGSIVARATSTNSPSSALSSCDTCLIRSVTLRAYLQGLLYIGYVYIGNTIGLAVRLPAGLFIGSIANIIGVADYAGALRAVFAVLVD